MHKASSSILEPQILIFRRCVETLWQLFLGINGALVFWSGFVGLLFTSTLLLFLQTLVLCSVSQSTAHGSCQLG